MIHLAHYRYYDRATGEWRNSLGGVPWCLSDEGTEEQHVVTDDEGAVTCPECQRHIRFVNGWGNVAEDIDWFGEEA